MNATEASRNESPPSEAESSGHLDLILASTSPRRSDLLKECGYVFRVVAPGCEESAEGHYTPRELSLLNAKRKSQAVAVFAPRAVVIGADTVVAIHGETLGKPRDLAEAVRMLHKLSGQTHQVLTSVWITRLHPFHLVAFSEVSEVTFRPLTTAMIEAYLARINPLDKAGAYAAQEYREDIIEHIEGSLNNVIGLPVEVLALALAEF